MNTQNLKLHSILFSTIALFGISSSALAVDGVVLIDQSRALAGNVTPGDGPGFPVSIKTSGSYRLASNLTATSTATSNGILVEADDVTIDLNGFTISAGNNGISAVQGKNLTIRNGTIHTSHNVALASAGYDTRIEDVIITGSFQGIIIGGAGKARAVIRNSNISNNTQFGVAVDAADCLIEGNIISGNGQSGIVIEAHDQNTNVYGGGCKIVNNTINQNGDYGIGAYWFSGNSGAQIQNNLINYNTDGGLRIGFGNSVVYGGNVFMGNNGGNSNEQIITDPGHPGIQISPNVCGINPTCP